MNGPKVLITGGSGMVGRYLTSLLLAEGFQVSHLSRQHSGFGKVRVYKWDPDRQIIDPVIFEGIDYIIHLAGVNIGEKRWTRQRKDEIVRSRVDSALFLHKIISDNDIPLKAFISASGTGYYGSATSQRIFTEEDLPGYDFLADTCRKWEEAACRFSNSGIRTVRIRTAVVLEKNSEILLKFRRPADMGIFLIPGKGHHYIPWIHISDLCNIYLKALTDDQMEGPYNASSPGHASQREFVKILALATEKKGVFLPVPAFIIKASLGRMADMVTRGSRISPEKLINAGYQFKFDNLQDALNDIIRQ
jgi:uncharacterized protein (TIGR01777 family)